MATSTIPCNYKKGQITTSASIDLSNLKVYQNDRVVTINGYIPSFGCSANTNVRVGFLSGVDLPKATIRGLCGVAVHAWEHPSDVAYVYIDNSDGSVYITSSLTGSYAVYMSLSYIVGN